MPADLAPTGATTGADSVDPSAPAPTVAAVASLFQSAGQGNLLLDLQGTIVFVGGEAERLLGIPTGHAQHANLLTVVPDAVQIPLADALNALRQGRTAAPFDVRWSQDHREVELLLHASAMAEDGQTLGFVVQVFESAARRAVDAALHGDFAGAIAAAERSPFAVMLLDPRGRCAHLSPCWTGLTGQSTAETLGIGWLTAVDEEHLEPFRETAAAAHRERSGWRTSFAVQALGGRRQWMDVAAAPCIDPDGTLHAYVVVMAPAPGRAHDDVAAVTAPAAQPVEDALVEDAPAEPVAPLWDLTAGATTEAVDTEDEVVEAAPVDESEEPATVATPEPPVVSATVLAATATVFVGSAEPTEPVAPAATSTTEREAERPVTSEAPATEAPTTEVALPAGDTTAPATRIPTFDGPSISDGRTVGSTESTQDDAFTVPESFTVPDTFDAVELTASIANAPVEPAAIWTPTIQTDMQVDVDRLIGATKVESVAPELDSMVLDTAVVDKVTGLPNRLLFAKTISETTERKDREGLNLSVAFIDLHGLRDQQARVGARAATDYLFLIAKRLEATIRSIETAARVDSHVLGVLSINWLFAEDLPILAQRLLNKLQEPLATRDGGEVRIAMNLGLAVIRSDEDVNSVFARAGGALSRARIGGAGAFDIDYGV